ncbi:hypothetical protein E2C01_057146 [Portunus trituberculatus]|uniref:Uncharacterized protein n=1 Tax=Portunus trituberculatus TaxID=210409 RepID=A0A5B7H2K0_PORTR|nr:hypothetical protein [Portunus trituberculatus]
MTRFVIPSFPFLRRACLPEPRESARGWRVCRILALWSGRGHLFVLFTYYGKSRLWRHSSMSTRALNILGKRPPYGNTTLASSQQDFSFVLVHIRRIRTFGIAKEANTLRAQGSGPSPSLLQGIVRRGIEGECEWLSVGGCWLRLIEVSEWYDFQPVVMLPRRRQVAV